MLQDLASRGELMTITALQIASTSDCDGESRWKHEPLSMASLKEYIMDSDGHEFRGEESNPFRTSSIYYKFYRNRKKPRTLFPWQNHEVLMSFTSSQIKQITSKF